MLIKKIFSSKIVIIALGFMFVSSCTDENNDGNDLVPQDQIDFDEYYEFQLIDLSPKEINATIYLPDETANIGASTKPNVVHEDGELYWSIEIGNDFVLKIEDQADYLDLIDFRKKTLKQNSFFKIDYIIEDSTLIMYKKTLLPKAVKAASAQVGVEHVSFHVYGQKVIDGITYSIESKDEGYDKNIIDLMVKSIRSIEEIKK